MTVSTPLRCALLGVTILGVGTLSQAQQAPKRNVPAAPATKSAARPPARTTDPKVQQAGGTAAPRRPRPQTVEMKIEPLSPELENILKEWEEESAKIKRIVGKHQRIVYNTVFEVAKQADGEFFYETPDKGRIDLVGIKTEEGAKADRVNPETKQAYRLEADQQSKWICNGQEILSINEEEKTYEVFPLPEDLRGENIINGPLPFLFGMKAVEAKKRFAISYVDEKDPRKNNAKVVWLKAIPRVMMDKENFREAHIILDRQRYVPLAVRLIDPSGNLETVYKFPKNDLRINGRELLPEVFRNDPFKPKLAKYKMILPPKPDEIQQTRSEEEQPRSKTTATPKSKSASRTNK